MFPKISVSIPEDSNEHNDHDAEVRMHAPRLSTVPEGKYEPRAEARTQGGKRIFCVEGSFDVMT